MQKLAAEKVHGERPVALMTHARTFRSPDTLSRPHRAVEPSGTEGRAQYGGGSDKCTAGFRWRGPPDGVSLTVDPRSSSLAMNSAGIPLSAAGGTSPRSTIHLPT